MAAKGVVSDRRPYAELLGVAHSPDSVDPAVDDVECVHRHSYAVELRHQTRLTVDGALENAQVRYLGRDVDVGARDLLAALDRVQMRHGESAAVRDCCRVGIEKADQRLDVLGFPRLLEILED